MKSIREMERMLAELDDPPEAYLLAWAELLKARVVEIQAILTRRRAWQSLRAEIDKLEFPERSQTPPKQDCSPSDAPATMRGMPGMQPQGEAASPRSSYSVHPDAKP